MPYRIIRHYQDATPNHRTIVRGLTLDEAQEHCRDAEASSKTCTSYTGRRRTEQMGPWFDGYTDGR